MTTVNGETITPTQEEIKRMACLTERVKYLSNLMDVKMEEVYRLITCNILDPKKVSEKTKEITKLVAELKAEASQKKIEIEKIRARILPETHLIPMNRDDLHHII